MNPAKIEAAKLGFEAFWPQKKWAFCGTAAKSLIADQPMSDKETIEGARNRAKHALELLPEAAFGIGLEGGLHQISSHHFCCGWMVVRDKEGNEGIGATVKMPVAGETIELIKGGMELGHASDKVFNRTNSKHAEGYFGILTKELITRSSGYRDGVIVALADLQMHSGVLVHQETA